MADNHNRGSSDAFRRRQEARRRREPQTIDAKAQDVTTSPVSDPSETGPQQSDLVGETPIGAKAAAPDTVTPASPDTAIIGADRAVLSPTETDRSAETRTDPTASVASFAGVTDPMAPAAEPVWWSDPQHQPDEFKASPANGHPAEPLASGEPVPVAEFVRTPPTEVVEDAPEPGAKTPDHTSAAADADPAEPGLADSPVPMSEHVHSLESEAAWAKPAPASEDASEPHPSSGEFNAASSSSLPLPEPERPRGSANRTGETAPVGPGAAGPASARDGRRSFLPATLAALAALIIAGLAGIYYGTHLGNSADLAAQVDALTQRVATLEARPAPPPPAVDLGASQARSNALDGDVAALKTAITDLTARLEQTTRASSDNSGRIAALEQHASTVPAPPPAAATGEASPPAVPAPATTPEIASPPDTAGDTAPAPAASVPPPAIPAAPDSAGGDADLAALTGRVDDLSKRLAALPTEAPAPADLAPLQGRLSDLAARLEAQQATVAALPRVDEARLDTRLTALDQKLDATGRHVADVAQAVAAIPKLDLAPLQASIGEVDGRLKTVEAALAAPKSGEQVTEARAVGSSEESRAAPLAVVSSAIARALDDGRPFEPEVDALRGLGIDDAALGPLPVLAGPGAPTAATLRDRWADIQSKVVTAAGPKTGDSVLDRFAAGARSLVQVRQVGASPGDDPPAASARIGAALDRGDIADALGEWAKLPEASRTASQGWADAARSRLEADASVRALMVRAIAVLAPPKK